jgi:hypothetical protein
MADLKMAILQGTDFSNSNFTSVDLCNTDLTRCNLTRVFLDDEFSHVTCNEATKWPNGVRPLPTQNEVLEYLRHNPRALRKLEKKNEKLSRFLRRR